MGAIRIGLLVWVAVFCVADWTVEKRESMGTGACTRKNHSEKQTQGCAAFSGNARL